MVIYTAMAMYRILGCLIVTSKGSSVVSIVG